MFTGIIEELARVRSITRSKETARLTIESAICGSGTDKGDSVSVNGVCLTLTDKDGGLLSFDISPETLNSTNLKVLGEGQKVNLERSLRQADRIGGHFVTGHVDYVAKIISKAGRSGFIELRISLLDRLSLFLAEKGSVAVDGISLTVNNVSKDSFDVMLIPHTLSATTLGFKDKGSSLNIETDILAKYTQNFVLKSRDLPDSSISVDKDFLSRNGFI